MNSIQKGIYEEIDNFDRLNHLVESIVTEQESEFGEPAEEWLKSYIEPLTAGFTIKPQNKNDLEKIIKKFESEWIKTGEFPEQTATQIVKFIISLSRMQTRTKYGEIVGKEKESEKTQTSASTGNTPLADPSNPIARMIKYPDRPKEAKEGIYAVMDLIKKSQPQLFDNMFNGSRAEQQYEQWTKSKTSTPTK